MISGYCEEKYSPIKKIFEDYFLKQEEIGASFAIYKEGKPLIDLNTLCPLNFYVNKGLYLMIYPALRMHQYSVKREFMKISNIESML